MPTNPFAFPTVARRYEEGRPYFHPTVLGRVRERLGLVGKAPRALDVGCGTGLSSLALRELADEVDAVDPSPEMITLASRYPGIRFACGRAEALEFPPDTFDLITISQAIHWTDQARFLAEARRCLRPGGHLIVYDHFFLWRTEGVETFARWYRERYRARFPPPPRAEIALDGDYEEYLSPLAFDREALVRYLLTQSNVCSACDARGLGVETATHWLHEETAPFFAETKTLTFPFGGPIHYLPKGA